ncbi:MAG: serine/threonine protein kinase, partial [Pseudomonas sp.]|nr:serine/threonine protein kinase [Pseudomonas sp.]
MKLSELARAGRSPVLPLQLQLEDGAAPATQTLQTLLRVLPGQRYVGVAQWRGRSVLAKLL